ncbi:hypothetical protein [Streptomyces sp. NPDC018610]|uniref:hypothetical protein n=1 Tax=Streptomyces sp. NPDC018610 TaxID=3365049 RepID=UPI00379E6B0F
MSNMSKRFNIPVRGQGHRRPMDIGRQGRDAYRHAPRAPYVTAPDGLRALPSDGSASEDRGAAARGTPLGRPDRLAPDHLLRAR